jgi:hypothetical protein
MSDEFQIMNNSMHFLNVGAELKKRYKPLSCFERTGEVRSPKAGEWFVSIDRKGKPRYGTSCRFDLVESEYEILIPLPEKPHIVKKIVPKLLENMQ